MNEDLQKIYQPKAEGLGFHLICCFSVGYCICETLHRVASGYESIFSQKIDIGTSIRGLKKFNLLARERERQLLCFHSAL